MSIFKDMLKEGESLFRDAITLDYDYMPKTIPFREAEQEHIASCIKPLLQKRNGRNAFIYGTPGIGKTVACKHLLMELDEESDEIIPIYINCWQKNTTYKVIMEVCDLIGYKLTHNKKTDELFDIIKQHLNKKSVVFVFDEIDKLEDFDIIYYVLEGIYRKAVILITNYKEWILGLDQRIKSRLTPESIEFKPYDLAKTKGILSNRLEYAFVPGVWGMEEFNIVVETAFQLQDIRTGLYLLKEACNIAEDESSKKVSRSHVEKAIQKLNDFSIKNSNELEDEKRFILGVIKKNSGTKIGELFKVYQQEGGKKTYKAFQRAIKHLSENSFITTKKLAGGAEGNTTIVYYPSVKTLNEF